MEKIGSNLFLGSLSPGGRGTLMDLATAVSLPLGTVLHESQVIPDYAFLLTSGVASTIIKTKNGLCRGWAHGPRGCSGQPATFGPCASTCRIDD